MKISGTPLLLAIALLFAAEPIVFAATGSMPNHPPDIAGGWALELGSKFGSCAGPIDIAPPSDSSAGDWQAIYAITCDGDSGPKQELFAIRYNTEGNYHFIGSGLYPDIFDLHWSPDGKSLVGSGSFANVSLSAAMQK
jgi:hypothetical protein